MNRILLFSIMVYMLLTGCTTKVASSGNCGAAKRLIFIGLFDSDTISINDGDRKILYNITVSDGSKSFFVDSLIYNKKVEIRINRDTAFEINTCYPDQKIFIVEKKGYRDYVFKKEVDRVPVLQ